MVDDAEGNGWKNRGVISCSIQSSAAEDTTFATVPLDVESASSSEFFGESTSGVAACRNGSLLEAKGRIGWNSVSHSSIASEIVFPVNASLNAKQ